MKILDVPQSGSYAGVTHSRNRFGQYRRTRAVPVNPNTNAQALARQRLVDSAEGWRDLSDEQRAGWASLGSQMTRTDALGQTYNLTGLQAFISVNASLQVIGAAQVQTAPALALPDAPAISGITANSGTFEVTIAGPANGTKVVILASNQVSDGISFMKDLRLIQVFTMVLGGVADILSDYSAKFGLPVAGNKIFVAAYVISADGFASPREVSSTIAA